MEVLPFQKLKYNIHSIPRGTDLLHKFAGLQGIKEFSTYGTPDRNKVIRYIIYCYDPGSDFIEREPNLQKRKEMCLIEAGFERNKKDEFDPYLIDIMTLQSEAHRNMIFAYLEHINNRTWMMLVSTEEMFLEYQRLIMKPITLVPSKTPSNNDDGEVYYAELKEKDILVAADMKKKLREECNSMDSDIDRYYQKLFGDNEDLKDQFKQKKRVTPESIAVKNKK